MASRRKLLAGKAFVEPLPDFHILLLLRIKKPLTNIRERKYID
jgi:hypothetical protein